MSELLTYRLTILGCRFNHAEARDLESILQSRGLQEAASGVAADLEVVHSCTVTSTAAAKSRQAVRRARRRQTDGQESHPTGFDRSRGPDPEVFVTGCYVGTNRDEAASLTSGPDAVFEPTVDDNSTLGERFSHQLDHWLGHRRHEHPVREEADGCSQTSENQGSQAISSGVIQHLPLVKPGVGAGRHVRAELRIQDGCDAHCSFCIIPKIRRTLRSKTIADAVAEAGMLVDQGHQEIVLTGIFIGAYGHETSLRRRQTHQGHPYLADLLDAVAQVPGLERLRISSMEPGDINQGLLDAMVANRPVVVPHLHLPLQSGSERILRKMNRQYGIGAYLEMIDLVNGALTEDGLPPAITTDIICGFPGETEDDFQLTMEVARRVGYLHMHVFPYSERAGTAAARWADQSVPVPIRKARVRTLMDLESRVPDGLSLQYRRKMIGRSVRVILEQPVAGSESGPASVMRGRSDHYVPVHVNTDQVRGSLCTVTITGLTDDGLVGTTTSSPVSLPLLHGVT